MFLAESKAIHSSESLGRCFPILLMPYFAGSLNSEEGSLRGFKKRKKKRCNELPAARKVLPKPYHIDILVSYHV